MGYLLAFQGFWRYFLYGHSFLCFLCVMVTYEISSVSLWNCTCELGNNSSVSTQTSCESEQGCTRSSEIWGAAAKLYSGSKRQLSKWVSCEHCGQLRDYYWHAILYEFNLYLNLFGWGFLKICWTFQLYWLKTLELIKGHGLICLEISLWPAKQWLHRWSSISRWEQIIRTTHGLHVGFVNKSGAM